jgi:hypothetical protein
MEPGAQTRAQSCQDHPAGGQDHSLPGLWEWLHFTFQSPGREVEVGRCPLRLGKVSAEPQCRLLSAPSTGSPGRQEGGREDQSPGVEPAGLGTV